MGHETMKQLYLPVPVILEQLRLIKIDACNSSPQRARLLWKVGALICVLTGASLRGHEGFFLDIASTRKRIEKGRDGVIPKRAMKKALLTEEECSNLPEVCICLIGKFKGETGERHHSIVLANKTSSGLEIRWWIEKLLEVCAEEGKQSGYAFSDSDGAPPNSGVYNSLVRLYLERIQDKTPSLFAPTEDLDRYGISRTYRKSSETRALRAGMKETDVKVMNRWRVMEQAQGKRPRQAMVDHYADARGLASLTWKYSYSL
jgi:hypothetical protein